MSTDTLRTDAEHCIWQIYQDFYNATRHRVVTFPLIDLRSCQDFSAAVTNTLNRLRRSDARLPPTALILTMIKVCHAKVYPPEQRNKDKAKKSPVPRAFAYELFDRLQAEITPTVDIALTHIGRILTEAGTMRDANCLREAYQTYCARLDGAFSSRELQGLVNAVWRQHFPESLGLLNDNQVIAA